MPPLHTCSFFSLYFATPVLPETFVGNPDSPGRLWGFRTMLSRAVPQAALILSSTPSRRHIPGCAECLAARPSCALGQLFSILAADWWWPGEYVVGLRAWRSVSASPSLSFILLAPYIISNNFKEHSLNDGAYNSISGVLRTRAWFLWFMMSPGPIDGVVAP